MNLSLCQCRVMTFYKCSEDETPRIHYWSDPCSQRGRPNSQLKHGRITGLHDKVTWFGRWSRPQLPDPVPAPRITEAERRASRFGSFTPEQSNSPATPGGQGAQWFTEPKRAQRWRRENDSANNAATVDSNFTDFCNRTSKIAIKLSKELWGQMEVTWRFSLRIL
jgi:hypothetical protein